MKKKQSKNKKEFMKRIYIYTYLLSNSFKELLENIEEFP